LAVAQNYRLVLIEQSFRDSVWVATEVTRHNFPTHRLLVGSQLHKFRLRGRVGGVGSSIDLGSQQTLRPEPLRVVLESCLLRKTLRFFGEVGLQVGDSLWLGGLEGVECRFEVAAHVVNGAVRIECKRRAYVGHHGHVLLH
jgi:hypothetical protein